jgi:cyanoexosortase B-associated protein
MMSPLKSFQLPQTLKLLIVLLVLAIAAVPALPNYFTQDWFWNHPPAVPTLEQLKSLQQAGLTLPGWETLNHQIVEIGGKKWSTQTLSATSPIAEPELPNQVQLFLRPQTWYRDQPEVEWMDINGGQRWTADSLQHLHFTVEPPSTSGSQAPVIVEARFLRSWSKQQTYAVLQWYAWTKGGSSAPSRWFWADQLTQLRTSLQGDRGDRQRMPWVAVSLLIPIQPLGEIESVQPLAESLGQVVQSTLMAGALNSDA